MNATPADSSVAIANQKRFVKLVRKRLERFVTLLPKVLVSDDPEAIHDLRVSSRRLQQAVRVIITIPTPSKGKKVIRVLRQVRRALGPCRNLDVNLALIKEKRKHAGATLVQHAWEAVQTDLDERRGPALKRARPIIAQHDVFAFIARTKSLIKGAERDADPVEVLDRAAAQSMKPWEDSFRSAYEHRDEPHLHELRIATKRLRYRAELLADLGQAKAKRLVAALKELQTMLGDWHDRWVLLHHVAEFIGRPNFLASHPDMSRALLAEIEKEKLRNDTTIDQILQNGAKVRESLARWNSLADEIEETAR
jgi:CHAD domain-containing protein